ncbi:MAG: hypothetical protein K2M82_00845 [Lachnospiraceae bacterium]|nr:hypothetical protein [Lachnospiraceae bacterium]
MNSFLSFPLLYYNLRSRTKNFVVWSLISLCLFILIIVMFMNILNAGLPSFINDMLAAVSGGNGNSLPDFSDFNVDFGVCMQIMLVVGCVYASYLGASAISNGDGDITFIYAQPITRLCTVLTTFVAQIVILFFYNLVVLLVSAAVLYSNNKMMNMGRVAMAVLAFILIEAVYLSLSLLFSTFMNSVSQATSISAVTVTATVVCAIVGAIPSLGVFKILSPYAYLSVYSIVTGGGKMFFMGIVASFVLIIVSATLSCIRYEKIDFLLD